MRVLVPLLEFNQPCTQPLPRVAGHLLSAGFGSKGPRWFDWAMLRLAGAEGGWQRWLLLRRQVDQPAELAYYRVFAPARTSLPRGTLPYELLQSLHVGAGRAPGQSCVLRRGRLD